jgi:hypothetical protein
VSLDLPVLLASVDWTPILVAAVTGITGVTAGAIGYLIARSQAGVERAKIEAETDRLRIEHELARAVERRNVYHEFMVTFYRFFMAGTGGQPFESESALMEWIVQEDSRGTAAQLFGTQEVREAVGGSRSYRPRSPGKSTLTPTFRKVWRMPFTPATTIGGVRTRLLSMQCVRT